LISAKVLADSINPRGVRLTTFEATFPRSILAEINTHRSMSRNSASTRAIPVERIVAAVTVRPYVPREWGKNCAGMAAHEELPVEVQQYAEAEWLRARDDAVARAENLRKAGVHKQITNQLLTPFMWQTAIISVTDIEHFYALRDAKDANPPFQDLARAMKKAQDASEPDLLGYTDPLDLHLPLVSEEEKRDWGREVALKLSAGRCAAVSYDRHQRVDPVKDQERFMKMVESGHWSAIEHQAWAAPYDFYRGNFGLGWVQYRKTFMFENCHHEFLRAKAGT
jgi:hypothetical protein